MNRFKFTGILLSLTLLAAAVSAQAKLTCIYDRGAQLCADIDDPASGPDDGTAEASR